jgi:hypothetical protein
VLAAVLMLVIAKLVSVGVTAFVFEVTRPKLMQMDWFRRFYDAVMRLLARAHALVDPVKQQVRRALRMFSPQRAGRTLRLLRRVRRRMRAARATA